MAGVPLPVAMIMIVSAGRRSPVSVCTLTCPVLCACAESMVLYTYIMLHSSIHPDVVTSESEDYMMKTCSSN